MNLMKIEFFHDTICSFCFPMSARMRKINEKYPEIDIEHRSFALGYEVENFVQSFGSHEAVKPEVLNHWEQANQNDDDHRFNIEGMENTDFNFPHSKPGLIAAKAAGIIAGEEGYWEVFDAIQHGLFVENRNTADINVLEDIVSSTSIEFNEWKEQVKNEETEKAVLADFERARAFGLRGVPALVINEKYLITGAQPQGAIEQAIEQVKEEQ